MTKITPGPWGCVHTSNHAHDYRLTQPDGWPLAMPASIDNSEQRANAKAIAALPDLIAALTAILHWDDKELLLLTEDRKAAIAALTKAGVKP
jgi:hypothetical protein